MKDLTRSPFSIPVCFVVLLSAPSSLLAQPTASQVAQAPVTQPPAPAAQQAVQTPGAGQLQLPQKVPLPNRLNEVLPRWLRVRGEFRERMEGFDGLGFNSTREDLYWLSRFRFNATAIASKELSFQVQVQDARVAKKTVGPTGSPFRAPFDLRLAFSDVGSTTRPFTVRVGRQELVYGEQRLVGHVSWLNAARTWDAVKVTYRRKAFQLDAFGASLVRILDNELDKSGNGNRFAGAYLTTGAVLPKATVEPYVFWKRDVNLRTELGAINDLEHTTAGVRVTGRLPARLDYGVEMAVQRGAVGSDDIRAWAGHWQLRESLPGAGAVTLTSEYNYASGDKDPTDGVRGTFDQLYPTPHDKTGLADQIGWKNLHHVRAGVELTPIKALPIAANYHSWWLAERRDAVYNVGNATLARVIAGAADGHIGQEIDVQVSRSLTPQLQLAAGYAHIFTGAFLKEATPGASYSHPYVMATYVFLADK